MPQDARIASRLLRRIEARNRELMTETAVDAAMGVFATVLTAGILYCIAWFVFKTIAGRGFPASTVALCTTALYVVVSAISAWKQVDPFVGLKPMSDTDHLLFAVSAGVNGYVHMNRHTVAGFATLLMGGPVNLVSALGSWLHRLPTDPQVIDQAVEILAACRPEIDLKKARASFPAAVLLRRLNLIVPRADSTVVTLTEKGREVIGKSAPTADPE